MHAVRWRSSRAPTHLPSQAIPCRRRCFYWTPRQNNAPETNTDETPDALRDSDRTSRESDTREGERGSGSAAAGHAKQKNSHGSITGGRVSRWRPKVNGNGTASISGSESKANGGLPPVEIPDWFLERNVKLSEKLRTRKDLNTALHLKDPENGHLIASLPSWHNFRHSTYGPSTSKEERLEKGLIRSGKDGMFMSSVVIAEIAASISAGLSIPLSKTGQSFPAAKSNLILHCPFNGFDDLLQAIVHVLAAHLNADVITINAQDISEVIGNHLSDPQEPEYRENSWRNLVYDVQDAERRLRQLSEKAQQAHDDAGTENEMQDMEDSEPASRKAFALSNSKGLDGISYHPVSSVADLVKLTQSLKSISQNYFDSSDDSGRSSSYSFLGRGTSSSARQWEELKLSTVLESLLETNKTKRQAIETIPTPSSSDGRTAHTASPESIVAHSEELRPDPYFEQEMAVMNEFFQSIRMGHEKSMFCIETSPSASKESNQQSLVPITNEQPLIVLVEDIKNLNDTINGTRFLQKLEKIVRQKRSEGSPVVIVGISSNEHHSPDRDSDSGSDISQWQADMESSVYRTIIVPPCLGRLQDMPIVPAPSEDMAELAFQGSTASDIQKIIANSRSLAAMCKRVNGHLTPPSLGRFLVDHMPLYGNSLDFNDAHRLTLVARGLRQNVAADEMHPAQFVAALALTIWSDKIKAFWVQRGREQRVPSLEDTDSSGTSSTNQKLPRAKVSVESRLKQLEKVATHHEKRLLPGVIDPRNLTTTFSSVHTSPRTIEALKTLTSLSLSRPDAFTYGVLASSKIPGLLLYGPPGTGKTLLAKAVASESGATMLEVSGGDIYDMYVGEGEKNVKAIFSLARKLSPCVVFIDEADAIFRSRGGERSATSHREIINQFLREWDGMNDAKESVFIMVATNRPFDLDDAVLRRLPRRLLVDLPVQQDREAILRIHLRDEILDPDVKLTDLAKRTPLYSGSDLKNLCVAAALACVRDENEFLHSHQLQVAASKTSGQATKIPTAQSDSQHLEQEAENAKSEKSFEAFRLPEKRILREHHFDKAMEEIGASISEDMSSLNAMKQFDEKYGDRQGRKGRTPWGFGAGKGLEEAGEGARVRKD
ncbi:MAG: hypothetical protein Q9157_000023 [Trypethelium eluteriae]